MTTARRDDRAAVGWAWTGRNLILDEALPGCGVGPVTVSVSEVSIGPTGRLFNADGL